MTVRLNYAEAAPEVVDALFAIELYMKKISRQGELSGTVLELIKTRASQINGCAYCLDMHTKDARAAGESEQRLYALPAWRDAPFFSEP